MAICAVGDDGVRASYSEKGANLWMCAPSQGRGNHGITTTDLTGNAGVNPSATESALPNPQTNTNYTNSFNGTSAATPVASGVVALVLQANPALTWRDVWLVLAQSARKNDSGNSGWTTNGATPPFNINHEYGFGVVDAAAAVALAKTWSNVGEGLIHTPATRSPGTTILDDTTGVSDTMTVSGSGINKIEWIAITFTGSRAASPGDIAITLTNNTTNTASILSESHFCQETAGFTEVTCTDYTGGWTFGTARHLGEAADGTWTLKVVAAVGDNGSGTFTSWKLVFHGRG